MIKRTTSAGQMKTRIAGTFFGNPADFKSQGQNTMPFLQWSSLVYVYHSWQRGPRLPLSANASHRGLDTMFSEGPGSGYARGCRMLREPQREVRFGFLRGAGDVSAQWAGIFSEDHRLS